MTFQLRIECDNAAFADDALGSELARILRDTAVRLSDDDLGPFALFDVNGNRVGSATLNGRR